jgi:hypothetical protein
VKKKEEEDEEEEPIKGFTLAVLALFLQIRDQSTLRGKVYSGSQFWSFQSRID